MRSCCSRLKSREAISHTEATHPPHRQMWKGAPCQCLCCCCHLHAGLDKAEESAYIDIAIQVCVSQKCQAGAKLPFFPFQHLVRFRLASEGDQEHLWSSGYNVSLTRWRSPVRSWPGVLLLPCNLYACGSCACKERLLPTPYPLRDRWGNVQKSIGGLMCKCKRTHQPWIHVHGS